MTSTSNRFISISSLEDKCCDVIAKNADHLTSIRGLDIQLCVKVLAKILEKGKLNYNIALVFRESGHEEVRR